MRPALAFAMAPAVLAVLVALLFLSWSAILPIMAVTYAHALVLGVPAFLLFRHRPWFGSAAVLIASFAIGLIPTAVIQFWVSSFVGFRQSGTDVLVENGVITAAGVRSAVEMSVYAGLLGLAGGTVWLLIAGGPANFNRSRARSPAPAETPVP